MIKFALKRKIYSLQKVGVTLDEDTILRLCPEGSLGHSLEGVVQEISRPEEVDPWVGRGVWGERAGICPESSSGESRLHCRLRTMKTEGTRPRHLQGPK